MKILKTEQELIGKKIKKVISFDDLIILFDDDSFARYRADTIYYSEETGFDTNLVMITDRDLTEYEMMSLGLTPVFGEIKE